MAKKRRGNKQRILNRYIVFVVIFLIFGLIIIGKLFHTTIIMGERWNARAEKELQKEIPIPPERGSILADNGSILACNLTVYDIKVDFRHNKIMNLRTINMKQIDSLADSLDMYYPRRERLRQHPDTFAKYTWHKKLRKEFEKLAGKRSRAMRLAKNKTIDDLNRIRNFPFFNKFGQRRSPVYKEEKNIRMYPYGRMASRSIGRVNMDSTTGQQHGYSGLEKDLDSLLYGQSGVAKFVPLTSGISRWVSVEPVRGYDIRTTIDIDLQDIVEEELRKILQSSRSEWGTAILMEVKTGEIKAISNVELLKDGTYGEALNRAVLPFEPGSVMKPISLMIAFEDGLVRSIHDGIDCSPFQQTSDHAGGGVKSVQEVIETSSNPGISRIIFRGYAKNPASFHTRMEELGFFEPLRSGIAGECVPRIKKLLPFNSRGHKVSMIARHLDLARQSFGYNTELPPLFTLSVYNAIANGGRYVRPRLVKGLTNSDGLDSIVPVQFIRERICSESTAAKVRECLDAVVWGKHGTAQRLQSDLVRIAGKTGTVFPVERGGYNKLKRRFAFAGYFPADKPLYSCFVLTLSPAGLSAAQTSGTVLKQVAEKMYSRGMLNNASSYRDNPKNNYPVMYKSNSVNTNKLARAIGVSQVNYLQASKQNRKGYMPDVKNMDFAEALKLLESYGLNVRFTGIGHVKSQSIPPGTKIKKGSIVNLYLGS